MDGNTPVKRRLTAILATDAVGYSARMAENEERTLKTLSGHRRLIDSLIADHGGRIVGTAGDSVLAEFGSSVEAVRCAVEIQEALATRNDSLPEAERLQFRIGINLGDVIVDGADILGDGVNVASRLEGIADPGGICIASSVFDQISGKLNLGFEDIGERSLKNIGRPVHAYRIARAGAALRPQRRSRQAGLVIAATSAVIVIALGVAYVVVTREPSNAPQPTDVAAAAPPAAQATAPPTAAAPPTPIEPAKPAPARADDPAKGATPPQQKAEPRAAEATPSVQQTPASETPPGRPPGNRAMSYTAGLAQARCQRPDGTLGPIVRGPAQVVSGEVIIAVGDPDEPGRVDLRGKPAADGTLVLDGFIIPTAGPARGTKVAARYEGKLSDGRGMLTGTQGMQRCSLRLQLK